MQEVDRFSLPRAIDAGDHDDDGEARCLQRGLRAQQVDAQRKLRGVELFLGDATSQLRCLEHRVVRSWERVVPAAPNDYGARVPSARSRSTESGPVVLYRATVVPTSLPS